MAIFSFSGTFPAYQGSYDGNLNRLRGLSTAEVVDEYEDVQFGSGLAETFSYLFNPVRRGHADAASEVLRERARDLSEDLSDNDRSHERP